MDAELPVVCRLERDQEVNTPCFFAKRDVGLVDAGAGWAKWMSVLGLIPETLVPPVNGIRRYRVRLWALDLDQPHVFHHGSCTEGTPLGHWDCEFDWDFEGLGWQEEEPPTGTM